MRVCARFQSTPPVKAATEYIDGFAYIREFQSTPPVKAATAVRMVSQPVRYISIHAAREGGDYAGGVLCYTVSISIHAAREGGDGG